METTTIQLKKRTRARLEKLKVNEHEPMDAVIERLLDLSIDEEPLSTKEIEGIKAGLKDIEEGRVYTLEQVKKRMGVK
jgi:predicted transcriptional regulator